MHLGARHFATVLTTCLGSLWAQASRALPTASPFRWVPRDAILVVQADGLARWPDRLAGTAAGKLLERPNFRTLLRPLVDPVQRFRTQALEHTKVDLDPALRALTEYRGRATLSLSSDLATLIAGLLRDQRDDPPPFVVQLTLSQDGATDLGKIATVVGDLVRSASEKLSTSRLDVASTTFTLVAVGAREERFAVTLPEVVDGQLVVFAGTHLDKLLPKFTQLAKDQRFVPGPEFETSALAARLQIGPVIAALLAAGAKADAGEELASAMRMLRATGCEAIRSLDVSVEAAEPFVRVVASIAFAGAPKGLLAALFPGLDSTEPKAELATLDLVPRDARSFAVRRVDWLRLLDGVVAVTESMSGGEASGGQNRLEEEFEGEVGVKLRLDLLSGLAPDVALLFEVPPKLEGRGRDGESFGLTVATTIVKKAVAEAFAKCFAKLDEQTGDHEKKHGDTVIRWVDFFGVPFLTHAPNSAFVSLGVGGLSIGQAGGLLDRAKASGAVKGRGAWPPAIAKRLAQMPTAFDGIAVVDLASLLAVSGRDLARELARENKDAEPGDPVRELLRGLEELELDRCVTTEHVHERRVVFLTLW